MIYRLPRFVSFFLVAALFIGLFAVLVSPGQPVIAAPTTQFAGSSVPGDCTPSAEPTFTPTPRASSTPRPRRSTVGGNIDTFAQAESATMPYGPSAFANGGLRPDALPPALAAQPAGQWPATSFNGQPYVVPTRVPAFGTAHQPKRVVLQSGHWQVANLPDELEELRDSTGTSAAGRTEAQLNLDVARRTAALLTTRGYVVQIVPATVPIDCQADVFVAIHADGSTATSKRGFKIARPRYVDNPVNRRLLADLYIEYGTATSLPRSDTLTRNMTGYYAFSARRYQHAVNPRVPMAIVEMGYMTNATDRRVLFNTPDLAAVGIANGIDRFLQGKLTAPSTLHLLATTASLLLQSG